MSTLILTHGDTDGLCSGALALSRYRDARVIFTSPMEVIEDLGHSRDYDRVIICDIAIDISIASALKAVVDHIASKKEVVYIDHHPLPHGFSAPWLVHNTDACGSLLTFQHFRKELNPNMSRVAMYGAIGDYRDTTPIAREIVKRWDRRSLYYEGGTLSQAIELERRGYNGKHMIVEELAKNVLPSEIDGLAHKAVEVSRLEERLRDRVEQTVQQMSHFAYVIDPEGFISKAAIYARIYGNRPVGLCAEYDEKRRVYDLSVRTDTDVDLNVVLNEAATRFGGHGGGHPQAGGGRIPEHNLKKFLSYLDDLLGHEMSHKGRKVPA
jgi:single-stranded-DNA-specific exonuclease